MNTSRPKRTGRPKWKQSETASRTPLLDAAWMLLDAPGSFSTCVRNFNRHAVLTNSHMSEIATFGCKLPLHSTITFRPSPTRHERSRARVRFPAQPMVMPNSRTTMSGVPTRSSATKHRTLPQCLTGPALTIHSHTATHTVPNTPQYTAPTTHWPVH